MANDFNKEERVAFEQILEGFQDAEVMSKNVGKYQTDQQSMERSNDEIWRPIPYVMTSYDGQDMTSNFKDKTQLAVPASINIEKSSPWEMTATQLRDSYQEGNLGKGARQKIASDINVSVLDIASQGTLVVPVDAAASGFDDVALCEAIMNEQGVNDMDRILALSTRDYLGMAGNLADRSDLAAKKALTAYEKAYVGEICSFDTWKLDYSRRITAAAGGAITIATNAAGNFYTPKGVDLTQAGQKNVDNRTDTVTVSATANVAEGDAFTIAGVNAVHQITKEDTGQLKTFRVVEVLTGTTMVIAPPLVDPDAGAGAESEKQYQNVKLGTASATSAITWLNKKAARINPFWFKDSIEILPGRYAIPENAGAATMRGNTDSGLELVMTKQFDINTYKTKFRIDARWGVVNLAPEMSGILLFDQT